MNDDGFGGRSIGTLPEHSFHFPSSYCKHNLCSALNLSKLINSGTRCTAGAVVSLNSYFLGIIGPDLSSELHPEKSANTTPQFTGTDHHSLSICISQY
jgi:hypothetical protein